MNDNGVLKSTPPAWAGTFWSSSSPSPCSKLKSTPPAWAGTEATADRAMILELKSTPPAWAGTGEPRTERTSCLA